ncbi:type-IV secretion system protein TraC [Mycobacteroides abscessus subsp. abscessus]|nr:type-IV secretion system protein TraC [Mycobacteroides abscessus subsp. abscessus]
MAPYIPKMTKFPGNVQYMADGTIWANYILQGIDATPCNPETFTSCQIANEELFVQLSTLNAADFKLLGLLGKTPHDEVLRRYVDGVPDFWQPGKFPLLEHMVNGFHRQLLAEPEFQRVYWLSVCLPVSRSNKDRLLSSVAVIDPHGDVGPLWIAELEARYFQAIPMQFEPKKANPDHVRWAYDRMRTMGDEAPDIPSGDGTRVAVAGPNTFPEIDINKSADGEALAEDFVDKVVAQLRTDPDAIQTYKDTWGDNLRAKFRDNFTSTTDGRALAVKNIEDRNKDFPDGYVSFQTRLVIAEYPKKLSWGVNTFTYLVDQLKRSDGITGDFMMTFDFNADDIDDEELKRVRNELNAEDKANSKHQFDAENYQRRRSEHDKFREAVKNDTAPTGMRVCTVFAFGSQNLNTLNHGVDKIRQHLLRQDFKPMMPIGGQYELLEAMMPGASSSPMIEDYKQVTTTKLLSGMMPIRRTIAGDPVGIPYARCKENALNQVMHWDVHNAPDKPSGGSFGITGRKGVGKSEQLKFRACQMYAMRLPVHYLDQSAEGEVEVLAKALAELQVRATGNEAYRDDVQIVDCVDGDLSLDLLKILPMDKAQQVFMDLWLPLLQIGSMSEQANILAGCLDPQYRTNAQLWSTRDLIDHLPHYQGAGSAGADLKVKFDAWGRRPYTRAFIDPPGQKPLPPFASSAHFVVFRTHGLPVYRGDHFERDATDTNRFSQLAYTAIAEITAWRFQEIRAVCGFYADELNFQKGSTVLFRLVETPDRVGRRGRNIVGIASQLGTDYDAAAKLVQERIMLAQGTRENAIASFIWGEVPPTKTLVDRMVNEASPPDPKNKNKTKKGYEGQGWLNDGNGHTVFGQLLGHFLEELRQASDTTSSTMTHARDLREREAADGRHSMLPQAV